MNGLCAGVPFLNSEIQGKFISKFIVVCEKFINNHIDPNRKYLVEVDCSPWSIDRKLKDFCFYGNFNNYLKQEKKIINYIKISS